MEPLIKATEGAFLSTIASIIVASTLTAITLIYFRVSLKIHCYKSLSNCKKAYLCINRAILTLNRDKLADESVLINTIDVSGTIKDHISRCTILPLTHSDKANLHYLKTYLLDYEILLREFHKTGSVDTLYELLSRLKSAYFLIHIFSMTDIIKANHLRDKAARDILFIDEHINHLLCDR